MLRVVKFLAICIIGSMLGFAVWHFSYRGYFQPWAKLSVGPQDIPSYFSPAVKYDVTKPCTSSDPQFSFFASPPKNIINCAEHEQFYPEAYRETTYALDNQGVMWKWEFFSYGPNAFAEMLCFPSIGLLMGFGLALAIEMAVALMKH